MVWLGLAVMTAGCVADPPEAAAPTCPVNGPPVDLGAAYPDEPPTTFQFSGGQALFTATGFLHDQPFDPEVGSTVVHLGPADTPPRYDRQRNTLTNVTNTLRVTEGRPTMQDLPAGRYWITTGGLPVALQPCGHATITDVQLGPLPRTQPEQQPGTRPAQGAAATPGRYAPVTQRR